MAEEVQCKTTIKRITFSGDNGFVIAKDMKGVAFKGVIIHEPSEITSTQILFHGTWEEHPQYGKQFNFTKYEIKEDYNFFFLTKIVKGIPRKSALEIIEKYGNKFEEIVENTPEELLTISGIGKKKLENIIESFRDNKHLKVLSDFLLPHGVTPTTIRNIYRHYEKNIAKGIAEIKKNPYVLTRMKGMGFRKADEIAIKVGMELDSPHRIESGILFALQDFCSSGGHTFVTKDILLNKAKEALLIEATKPEDKHFALTDELYFQTMTALETKKNPPFVFIENNRDCISPYPLHLAETTILRKLKQYGNENRAPLGILSYEELKNFISKAQIANGFEYDEMQKRAITLANSQPAIFFLYGLAGAGKTTVSKDILRLFSTKFGEENIICCALSGVASNRAKIVTGFKGSTIHALLGNQDGDWMFNEENKLSQKVIMLDEASMVDSYLFASLLRAIDFEKTTLMIVGDPFQLQSVGEGDVYRNIIDNSLAQGVGLQKVHRQKEEQIINVFATQYIRNGKLPDGVNEKYEDFDFRIVENAGYFAMKKDPEITELKLQEARETVKHRIKDEIVKVAKDHLYVKDFFITDTKKYISEFQVLSPMKKNILGTGTLNNAIQEVFNNHRYAENSIIRLPYKEIRPRDKVIHLSNRDMGVSSMANFKLSHKGKDIAGLMKSDKIMERRVLNGQIGVVVAILAEEDIVCVYYPLESYVAYYKKDDFNGGVIDLAWAITLHKSQGSEYGVMVMPISMSHFIMLNNQLLYTGVTRAKNKLYLIGEQYALKYGCTNISDTQRNTVIGLLSAGTKYDKQEKPKPKIDISTKKEPQKNSFLVL